ncbi:enolase C-terminal domain-like protein [Tunturiibacter lichenicola]|uniref:enolase C-terminal domain-like protein n=1 Tax=Tunturiibacter lichenicola TaxID=2051959 RepID=UPI003D9B30F9
MANNIIRSIATYDARFPLPAGAGTDSIHATSEYCLAVTLLATDSGLTGSGFVLTLGAGNELVGKAIEMLATPLQGKSIDEIMADFGRLSRSIADHAALRWLGPHKGVVHLALASITNACFDLWAKSRGVPLWKLLLDLSPEELVRVLDLSYVEDVVDEKRALEMLREHHATRASRERILATGYPGYDTSVGWMDYSDDKVRELTKAALDQGFSAFKLKVGSRKESRDLRRAAMLRELAGDDKTIMFDANQHWNLPDALRMCRELSKFKPLWIEEPTHPDDLLAHVEISDAIAPVRVAAGEHISNRVLFKNFLKAKALHFFQVDCTRVAGISEFLTVSFMAKIFNRPIVPHVGDMGQMHQHLMFFNHIALDHEVVFLEHIPHLRKHFVHPAEVSAGVYCTPQEPGASTDLKVNATA